jgi:hypothetical protein
MSRADKVKRFERLPQILPKPQSYTIFFHPDFTVGFGISPNHALRLVGFTTGRELHPALKILFYSVNDYTPSDLFLQVDFCWT